MVHRLQYIFLGLSLATVGAQAQTPEKLDIDDEFFAVGLTAGIVNVQDFNSELFWGFEGSFKASEDFFLQFNFMQADISPSSYELNQGLYFDGDDRKFTHYDFLVGYNLFQAEFYGDGPNSAISALYVVGGAGETEFGGENSFTITLGTGYQFALNRRYVLRLDYRDHIYQSIIIGENSSTHNTQISVGLSYLF